jgi:integrase
VAGRTRRDFGSLRKLRSGRWQAAYTGPDGRRHKAATTFGDKTTANLWLRRQQAAIADGSWGQPVPAARVVPTFTEYALRVIEHRVSNGLRPSTERKYRGLLAGHLLPAFGPVPIDQITVAGVNEWFTSYGRRVLPTRANAYRLLASMMKAAIDEGWRESNACRVRGGAADPRREHEAEAATPGQVDALAAAMRPQWRMAVLLGAYCQLRFGELAELRRKDVELDLAAGRGVIRVRRAMTRVDGVMLTGPPKSSAGIRAVAVPPHLLGDLAAHLAEHVQPGRDALLFTTPRGEQLYHAVIYGDWHKARADVGLPGFRFHDLRHTGLTWLARDGATLKERMHRAGHSDPRMAARYEHADAERDAANAERLSRRAQQGHQATVVPLHPKGARERRDA